MIHQYKFNFVLAALFFRDMDRNVTRDQLDSRTCAKKLLERLDNAISDASQHQSTHLTAEMVWQTLSQTPKVYFPILVCHILVLFILHTVPFFSIPLIAFDIDSLIPSEKMHPPIETTEKERSKKSFLPLPVPDEDKINRFWVVALIAIFVIVLLAIISFCFLKCIRAGLGNMLRIIYHFNFIMYFSVFPLFFIQEIVYVQNWAVDKILLGLVIYNFCFCGVLAMFYTFPKNIRKFYLIMLCAMTSSITIKL